MESNKAYRYRIYPNASQRGLIERTFGCCRWVWNRALAMHREAYEAGGKAPGVYEIMRLIPAWKATDAPWLAEVDLVETRSICARLFAYRRAQPWPPTVEKREGWDGLYAEQIAGLPVLKDVDEAIAWTNDLIRRIDR